MDQALNQKIDAFIAANKEQILEDIAALVAIDSVEGTPTEEATFGEGPRAALDKMCIRDSTGRCAPQHPRGHPETAALNLSVPLCVPAFLIGEMCIRDRCSFSKLNTGTLTAT